MPLQSARAAMAERGGARATLNADGSARRTARLELLAGGTQEELASTVGDAQGTFAKVCPSPTDPSFSGRPGDRDNRDAARAP